MRLYSICVAAAAILFATSALLLRFAFAHNEGLERATCMAGVCETGELATRAYQMLLAGGPETPAAIERFRTLVVRNPASPFVWATLAEAFAETGDDAAARNAMLQAIERGPAIPQIRIRAANLFSACGDRRAAGSSLAAVLRATPAFDQVVFDSFRRIPLSTSEVLTLLLDDPRATRAYFYDIRRHGSTKDLTLVWDCLLAAGYADQNMASTYLAAVPPGERIDRR
jgi:tetratricopeptide (TPR) repeat protein